MSLRRRGENRFLFLDHCSQAIEYETAQGAFNPRQQSLLAPDLAAIQQGVSAYDPLAGETGFQAFLGRHYRAIAMGASVVAGTALSLAT